MHCVVFHQFLNCPDLKELEMRNDLSANQKAIFDEKPLTKILATDYRTFTVKNGSKQVVFAGNSGSIRKNNESATVRLQLGLYGPDYEQVISSAYATPTGELSCFVASTLFLAPGDYTCTLQWVGDTAKNIDGAGVAIKAPEVLTEGGKFKKTLIIESGHGGALRTWLSGKNRDGISCEFDSVFRADAHGTGAKVSETVYHGTDHQFQQWDGPMTNLGGNVAEARVHQREFLSYLGREFPTLLAIARGNAGVDSRSHKLTLTLELET
jgi:hypothetical protein